MRSDRIAAALGASRTIKLPRMPRDPLDALVLMQTLHDEMESTRGRRPGRPSNRAWTLRRQVPFREETWALLGDYAAWFSEGGRSVSPAQVAAAILDRALTGERRSANRARSAEEAGAPPIVLGTQGAARTLNGDQVVRALVWYLEDPRVYDRFDVGARQERARLPNQVTQGDVDRLAQLKVRGRYRSAWAPLIDLGDLPALAGLPLDLDLASVAPKRWREKIQPLLSEVSRVLFPEGGGITGRDYSSASKLMHQKRDWIPILDDLVRQMLAMPSETGRISVEDRRARWLGRTDVVRRQIWANRDALQEYRERLAADRLGLGRSFELSTARILDIVLWSTGRRESRGR